MSVCYVIKNKEGKFWQFLHNSESEFVDEIYNAFFHYSKQDAEKSIVGFGLKNCKVVEITIEEVDNSKIEYNETIKYIETTEPDKVAEYIDNLNKQLAIIKRALLKASKEAFGNKISFVNSNYSKKITNSEEYAEYLIFEAGGEVKNEN